MPVEEGKGTGMVPGGRECTGSFILRVLKPGSLGADLREDLNRVFIGFSRCILSGS